MDAPPWTENTRPRSTFADSSQGSVNSYLTDESLFDDKEHNQIYCRADQLIEGIDRELRVPEDYYHGEPSKFTTINTRLFLKAILLYAPWKGISYVSRCVVDTNGDNVKLQYLAWVWLDAIVYPCESGLNIPDKKWETEPQTF